MATYSEFINTLCSLKEQSETVQFIKEHKDAFNVNEFVLSDINYIISLYVVHTYPESLKAFVEDIVIPNSLAQRANMDTLFAYNISTANSNYDSIQKTHAKYNRVISSKNHINDLLDIFNTLTLVDMESKYTHDFYSTIHELINLRNTQINISDAYIPFIMNHPLYNGEYENQLTKIDHFKPIINEVKSIQFANKLNSLLPEKKVIKNNKI